MDGVPNRMNFWKNSKPPSTQPSHFRKVMLQILYNGYGRIYARRHQGQIVWNVCRRFPEIGTILRGGGGGQRPFGSSAKIHPFWYPDQSIRLAWLLEPSSKSVLFWFSSIRLLKKHTLNPEPFCINFMLKKSCLKFPISATQIFGLMTLPPPWELFRKFIRFGTAILPLVAYICQHC